MKKFYNMTKQNHNLNPESFDLQGVARLMESPSLHSYWSWINQTSEINVILSGGSPVSRTRFGRSPSCRFTQGPRLSTFSKIRLLTFLRFPPFVLRTNFRMSGKSWSLKSKTAHFSHNGEIGADRTKKTKNKIHVKCSQNPMTVSILKL